MMLLVPRTVSIYTVAFLKCMITAVSGRGTFKGSLACPDIKIPICKSTK